MLDVIDVPLSPLQLSDRWRRMCVDPTFEDVPGKIELTQWGEIPFEPGGKTHGLLAAALAVLLIQKLGSKAMVEVGIRAPDIGGRSERSLASTFQNFISPNPCAM